MLNVVSRAWVMASCLTALALVLPFTMSMAASLSTTVLLLALGVAPGIVIALLKNGQASPTVAEILHTVEAKDVRP
jgi:hypothetical protein